MDSLRRLITPILLCSFYFWSITAFWSPSVQEKIRKLFAPREREILAVAVGRVIAGNSSIRVLKVRTPKGISIELYQPAEDGPQPLIDSVLIPDFHDATTQFQARAINLGLKDMDGDKVFEIIAPTLDSSLTPRLHIFHFNSDTRKLEPYVVN